MSKVRALTVCMSRTTIEVVYDCLQHVHTTARMPHFAHDTVRDALDLFTLYLSRLDDDGVFEEVFEGGRDEDD